MRLFIAIELPDEARNKLSGYASELCKVCSQGNFCTEYQLHLTLAFLGELAPSDVRKISALMDACNSSPMQLAVGKPGRFRREGGDILIRSCVCGKELYALQSELSSKLLSNGFNLEDRTYKPHFTLARKAILKPETSMPDAEDIPFTADHMTLFRSDRINGSMRYTPLHKTYFDNPANK